MCAVMAAAAAASPNCLAYSCLYVANPHRPSHTYRLEAHRNLCTVCFQWGLQQDNLIWLYEDLAALAKLLQGRQEGCKQMVVVGQQQVEALDNTLDRRTDGYGM